MPFSSAGPSPLRTVVLLRGPRPCAAVRTALPTALRTAPLRPPRNEGTIDGYPSLLVTYLGAGTDEASGSLYDIDGSAGAAERFKVRAFDADKYLLLELVSPEGTARDCVPNGPASNGYDAQPWAFTVTAPAGPPIKYIRLDSEGSESAPDVAFDNFNAFTRCQIGVDPPAAPATALGIGKGAPASGRREMDCKFRGV